MLAIDVTPAGTRDDWDLTSLSWTAKANDVSGASGLAASRISLAPASGTLTSSALQVSVDVSGLAPGTYTGKIHVTSDVGDPAGRDVIVKVDVTSPFMANSEVTRLPFNTPGATM